MDFVEPARPFALELVGGRGHYERVVRAAMEARRSVWIATANLKELMVEDHRAVPGRRRTARVTGARGGRRRLPLDPGGVRRARRPRRRAAHPARRRRRRGRSAPRWRAGRRLAPRARSCAPARASTSRRSSSTARSSTSAAPTGPGRGWAPRGRGGATSSSASRAPTTGCSIGCRSSTTASGAAAPAKAASCATLCPAPLDGARPTRPRHSEAPITPAGLARPGVVATFQPNAHDSMKSDHEGGLIALVKETASGFGQLVADHIRLARVEMTADAKSYVRDGGMLAGRRVHPGDRLRHWPASPAGLALRASSAGRWPSRAWRSCICSSARSRSG